MIDRLADHAGEFAHVAIANITREYPSYVMYVAQGPGQGGSNRELHPAFYGCFDWHSCVEMHWTLVRLLRLFPDAVPAEEARTTLGEALTPTHIATEVEFFEAHKGFQRPYGWGWLLALHHELATWDDDADARRWSDALTPLVELIERRLLDWLPLATYPVRHGLHFNSAFGLARAWPHALARPNTGVADTIRAAALRWFSTDRDYPAQLEPSGSDFLSPALTEAELMASVLDPADFIPWFDAFLPKVAQRRPASLFEPAVVSDATDGQIAHLHGLNLSRAFCWRRISEFLPDRDVRQDTIRDAITRHTDASLDQVSGSDYMVEHWLAAYAVLLLSGPTARPPRRRRRHLP